MTFFVLPAKPIQLESSRINNNGLRSTESRFYVPLDTKQGYFETFFSGNILARCWKNWTWQQKPTFTSNRKIPHHTTTVLRPFFQDHPGEPVPEENFWTLWCKGRLTEANTAIIRLDATPSGLTSAHLHHPPYFFTGRMPLLPPNQQCQSTESN